MGRFLTNLGYRVQEAADGFQAWSKFCDLDGQVDLLVTDLVMPDLSGPKLIARIRDHSPLLPVLCISGHPTAELNEKAGGQARTCFLRKPFTPSRLAAKIHEMLC